MDKGAVVATVERFVRELQGRDVQPQKVVLYGSHLSGSAKDHSDIDLVVVSESFAGMGYWDRIRVIADAVFAVYAPIEAVAMTPGEWDSGDSLIVEFARDGEVRYAP